MIDFDMGTIAGLGVALLGVGGGIGMIAFTESAGKRNDEKASSQPCVECRSEKVVTCPICKGSGTDPLASLVEGVREVSGEGKSARRVLVEDWASGPREVELFRDILSKYPPKATETICINCEARGVVVCDNCDGTGIQPRFLERYSPDDFMD